MNKEPILSILIPCYNGEITIARALNSILMQETEFDYEIIVIDDGSTDRSTNIVNEYVQNHKNIILLSNETNQGNAKTFYYGLKNTKRKYFAVLDVDDYYTINNKLQKQISFLEKDVDENYVAVTHNYIIDLGNGNTTIPNFNIISEFNYIDFINQKSGYYHTSTYIYRNIFQGNPPSLFTENRFRGDTVRTAIHLMYSNKKIKVLNFVGSAYYWSELGIWSSLDQKKQFDIQIRIWTGLKEISTTDIENKAYQKLIDQCIDKQKNVKETKREYESITISEAIEILNKRAEKFAFSQREYVFKGIYLSELLDSCAVSLGYVYHQNKPIDKKPLDNNTIGMMVCTLNPEGGGIFREITEIVEMYSEKKIIIFSTEDPPSQPSARKILKKYNNVKLMQCPKTNDKLEWLIKTYYKLSPYRTYYYDSHKDFFPFATMDRRCENICLFSYDHGYVSGLSSPNIKNIIAKRIIDYNLLRKKFGNKVIYIPAWNEATIDIDKKYIPFNEHEKLITACGAARFYKLESAGNVTYISLIVGLLKKTGGKHIHFGPIPDDKKIEIYNLLEKNNITKDSFIHIEWADNPPKLLLENNVDLFIEPFPIVSYKITMDMLMNGIPIISYDGYNRMSKVDFIYEDCIKWTDEENFYKKITEINEETLLYHSKKSKEYFYSTHDKKIVKEFFINNKPFTKIQDISCIDDSIEDIDDFKNLYDKEIMNLKKSSNNSFIRFEYDPKLSRSLLGKIAIIIIRINSAIINSSKTKGVSMVKSEEIVEMLSLNDNRKDHEAYNLCLKASHQSVAQGWLGRMSRDGRGTIKNIDKAIQWYTLSVSNNGPKWATTDLIDLLLARKNSNDSKNAFELCLSAAEEGNVSAMGLLGRMYRDGIGIESNVDEALKWFKCAYDANLNWASIEYIDLLIRRGTNDDKLDAFKICKKEAERGNAGAMGRLARMYRDGFGTDADINLSIKWMKKAVDENVKWANAEYIELLINTNSDINEEIAFEFCKKLTEEKNAQAMIILARMYRDGKGTDVNLDMSIQYFKKAFELNNRSAIIEYIDLLEKVNNNEEKEMAFDLCKKEAERGNAGAMGRLARMYRDGIGTKNDIDLAISWMKKALDKDVSWAFTEYIELLIKKNDKTSLKEAFEICLLESNKGNKKAINILVKMYRDGIGTDKDKKSADYWAKKT